MTAKTVELNDLDPDEGRTLKLAETINATADHQRTWIPRLLKISEAAEILGITTARAYSLARMGILPTVALGRQRRVSLAALEQFIANGGKGLPE